MQAMDDGSVNFLGLGPVERENIQAVRVMAAGLGTAVISAGALVCMPAPEEGELDYNTNTALNFFVAGSMWTATGFSMLNRDHMRRTFGNEIVTVLDRLRGNMAILAACWTAYTIYDAATFVSFKIDDEGNS